MLDTLEHLCLKYLSAKNLGGDAKLYKEILEMTVICKLLSDKQMAMFKSLSDTVKSRHIVAAISQIAQGYLMLKH